MVTSRHVIIFRTPNLLCMRGNSSCVLRFFSKFCQIFTIFMLVAFSVSCYLSYDDTIESASAYLSVNCGFESRSRLIFLTRRKISRCLAVVPRFIFFVNPLEVTILCRLSNLTKLLQNSKFFVRASFTNFDKGF